MSHLMQSNRIQYIRHRFRNILTCTLLSIFCFNVFLALLNIYGGLLNFISAVKYWHVRIILRKFA